MAAAPGGLSPSSQVARQDAPSGTPSGCSSRAPANRERTDGERNQREKFRLAVMYGKGAKDRPEYKQPASARKLSTFNVATADFLHPPEVPEINLAQYSGRQGDVIFVRAYDDVEVDRVGLMIVGSNNALVEQGQMSRDPNDKTLWTYAATADASGGHVQVLVDAADLASHVTTERAEKDF